jgi:hypothetical protein
LSPPQACSAPRPGEPLGVFVMASISVLSEFPHSREAHRVSQ